MTICFFEEGDKEKELGNLDSVAVPRAGEILTLREEQYKVTEVRWVLTTTVVTGNLRELEAHVYLWNRKYQ